MKMQNFVIWIQSAIAEGVETRFDTSSYELDRPFRKGKNKKVIGLVIDELGKNHERICWIKGKNL